MSTTSNECCVGSPSLNDTVSPLVKLYTFVESVIVPDVNPNVVPLAAVIFSDIVTVVPDTLVTVAPEPTCKLSCITFMPADIPETLATLNDVPFDTAPPTITAFTGFMFACATVESVGAAVILVIDITLAGPMFTMFAAIMFTPAKSDILTPLFSTTCWLVHTTNWSVKSASLITKW